MACTYVNQVFLADFFQEIYNLTGVRFSSDAPSDLIVLHPKRERRPRKDWTIARLIDEVVYNYVPKAVNVWAIDEDGNKVHGKTKYQKYLEYKTTY